MSRLATTALDWLFPPRCPFCRTLHRAGERGICGRCRTSLPWTTDAGSEQKGDFFVCCVSPLYYRDAVRRAILSYKFRGRRGLAACFGVLMADRLRRRDGAWDVVTWVPVSASRRLTRGYDQAELLARVVAGELGLPCRRILRKARSTARQSGLSDAAGRRANVSGAYRAVADAAGLRLLLVDDVITSGATLSECARTLLMAGAVRVDGATIARRRD